MFQVFDDCFNALVAITLLHGLTIYNNNKRRDKNNLSDGDICILICCFNRNHLLM